MQVGSVNAWAVAGIAAAVGAAIGGGSALLEASLRPWQVGDFSGEMLAPSNADAAEADVPETRHDFGTVGAGGKGSHEFVIHNRGNATLTLTRGATSCSCTVSDFDSTDGGDEGGRKEVPPDGSTRLRLTWKGKGAGGPFRQQATVFTNDPRRPEIAFVIEGTVVPTWKAVPDRLVLSKLSASSGEQASLRIFTYGTAPPTFEQFEATDPETAQFFSLSTAPLDAAEIAAETGATGGVLLKVGVLPGLPLGQLRQTLRATVRIPEEIQLEVPVEGTVGGDLALAGGGWDSSRQALLLGSVSGRKGSRTQVFLMAKGPHRSSVKPAVGEVVPASLVVEVGEGVPVGSGGTVRIPISISIPPGSPPANHRCSPQAPAGRIVLETGHPDTPTLTIPVCVAIDP
jgi:hypothetical protein